LLSARRACIDTGPTSVGEPNPYRWRLAGLLDADALKEAIFSTPTGSSTTSTGSQPSRAREQLRPSGLALSVISLAELYEGVHDARDPAASRRVLSRFVAGLTVVPVDDEICDIFGRERGKLRQQG
jgi:predicted nucleic acid-binding protein